jgi:PAS domain S-box-containing protein
MLVDKTGRILIDVDRADETLSDDTKHLLFVPIASGRPVLTDFYYCNIHKKAHIDVIVPMVQSEPTIKHLGLAVILRISPFEYLYPLMNNNAFQYRTFETLLVRPEGDSVLYLNELRFNPEAAMRLKVHLGETGVPAVRAVKGQRGPFEGIDYRGRRVLAVTGRVPDSNWHIVAKVETEEIYAPLKVRTALILATLATVLLFIGAYVVFTLMVQRKEYYKKLYRAETDRVALAKHYQYLSKYANDNIFVLDDKMKIVEVNDRVEETYGYTRDELIGMDAAMIRAESERQLLKEQMDESLKKNGMVYETVHRRKDGSTFPVEISARPIEIEGKLYQQGIVRDITERKKYEKELLDKNLEIQKNIANLEEANQELIASEEELRLSNEKLESNYAELEAANEELKVAEEDLVEKYQKLQKAEIEVQRAYEWSERIISSVPNIVVGLDPDSRVVLFNAFAEKVTGYRAEEVMGRKWLEIFIPSDTINEVAEVWDDLRNGPGVRRSYENDILCKNGSRRLINWNNTVIMESGQFKMILSLGADVTEIRRAELAVKEERDKLDAVMSSVPVALMVMDGDETIVRANPKAVELCGPDRESIYGLRCGDCLRCVHRNEGSKGCGTSLHCEECRLNRSINDVLSGRKGMQGADMCFNIETIDGQEERWFIVSVTPLAEGDQLQALVSLQDITERKINEKRIVNQLSELRQWQEVTLGREERVRELKLEVNRLLKAMGQDEKYN